MKSKYLLLICLCCLLSTVKAQKILSLHPLFTEPDAVVMEGIEGQWHIKGLDINISIEKAGDNFYILQYGRDTNQSTYEAGFVKVNDQLFLDLHGFLPETLGGNDYRESFIPGHSLYKVEMAKDSVQLFELNYAWFYNYASSIDTLLKYEWIKNAMLLTLKTEDLKALLAAHSMEKDFFKEPLSAIKTGRSHNEKSLNKKIGNLNPPAIFSQSCTPAFPFKDGWLGGDGDVSVAINDTTTLFLFSDTYVGNRGVVNRNEPGLKMVSNSVGIATCRAGGEAGMQYFWNKMYSESPEPIFRSNTNRYRYWIQDAFMINNNLYAINAKIATRTGLAPGDIFNFSLLGFTLAKISNPLDNPDQWQIEYIPLPGFGYTSLSVSCHAIQGDQIYFFVSANDKAQVLVRKPLAFIDDASKPFSYYALNKTWKEGLEINDMDAIIRGFRSTTVNYHADLKQWIMICDIAFMDNKIKMRTAPQLTGPWSEEKIIYEIPELTKGSKTYHKSNFCYLARECIQYYDPKTKTMVLTYDVNNTDFDQIKANPEIYRPRVIKVSLAKPGGSPSKNAK